MKKQSIVVTVFGRQFPARVDSDEAAVIKHAAKTINAKIRAFKAEYKTQDDLDIAIMCCLDIMTEHLSQDLLEQKNEETLLKELTQLDEKLNRTLELAEKD